MNLGIFSFSLVGVVKSVLTTFIGFFTFGGVPVTSLTITGVLLNTVGGILYSYAKYIEKKAAFQSVHNMTMGFSSKKNASIPTIEKQTTSDHDVEQGNQELEVVANGIDDRTRA